MFSERMRRRLARMFYPYELEKAYVTIASEYASLLYKAIKQYFPAMRRARARIDNICSPALRRQAQKREARKIERAARREFGRLEQSFKLDAKIETVANKASIFQKEAAEMLESQRKILEKKPKAVAKATPVPTAKSKTAAAWAKKNTALIKTLPEKGMTELNKIILDGWRTGETQASMAKKIQKLCGVSENKAKFWARDQMAKLNADMARERHMAAGVKEYVWSTSGDERVRGNPKGKYPKAKPSHYDINKKRCKYADPTVYKNNGEWAKRPANFPQVHPGYDFICRCVALPCYPGITMPWEKGE